ncbi:MAG TPA: hypothetical protein DCS93_03055 [Microscillaceae bacterium]|nr:hypothetical protein [Microscillaceae bacterium]
MLKLYCIALFCLISLSAIGQSPRKNDSLKAALQEDLPDTTKIHIFNQLSKGYARSQPDAAIIYANKAIDLAKRVNYVVGVAQALSNKGAVSATKGDYPSALNWHTKALEQYKAIQDVRGIASATNNIGVTYSIMGDRDQALSHFQEAERSYARIANLQGQAQAINNIGIVFKLQNQFKQSLTYFEKSLKINQQLNNKYEIARCYNNIGLIYKNLKQPKTALEYYQKSLKLSTALGDKRGIAYRYYNIAGIYEQTKEYTQALKYYQKSLTIGKTLQDKRTISNCLLSLGKVYQQTKEAQKALPFAQQAYEMALKTKDKKTQKNAVGLLATIYADLGDYKKAYDYEVTFKDKSDSLINAANIRKAAQREAQAKFAKQQEAQVKKIQQQRRFQLIYIIIIGLMLVLLILVLRNLSNKRTANKALQEKSDMIHSQNVEIVKQRDQILEKNELLKATSDELRLQKGLLIESIQYAQEIQQSVLPSAERMKHAFKDSFVFFKPLDLVSGDFYWVKEVDDTVFFAIADCTGHGIPGAFMSMLAISYLNEIVIPGISNDTGAILDTLREKIKYTLHQVNSEVEHKDGLDIAFCAFHKPTRQLNFSGGYSPLYIVKTHPEEVEAVGALPDKSKSYRVKTANEITLLEIKGDRQPVGIFIREKPFTTHQVTLNEGDLLYAFTDGYVDQLGGDKGRKFMAKHLKELILSHWQMPFVTQQETFEQTLINWQKQTPQVDDILLIGIKL